MDNGSMPNMLVTLTFNFMDSGNLEKVSFWSFFFYTLSRFLNIIG